MLWLKLIHVSKTDPRSICIYYGIYRVWRLTPTLHSASHNVGIHSITSMEVSETEIDGGIWRARDVLDGWWFNRHPNLKIITCIVAFLTHYVQSKNMNVNSDLFSVLKWRGYIRNIITAEDLSMQDVMPLAATLFIHFPTRQGVNEEVCTRSRYLRKV